MSGSWEEEPAGSLATSALTDVPVMDKPTDGLEHGAVRACATSAAGSSVQDAESFELHFDGENSYPECKRCGHCCHLNILAMTHEEVQRIRNYIVEHDIHPIDRHKQGCCLENPNGDGCMVWPVRSQTCRLHNCHVPRIEILKQNPSIHVPEDIPLVDLHECFINGVEIDPRYQLVEQA